MEQGRPRRERISGRIKRNVTSILRRRRQRAARNTRNREGEMPDLQLHREAVSSECNEMSQRVVELPDINHDELEQQQDTSLPEENSQAAEGVNTASDEKLLKDLPSGGYQKLVTFLQPLSVTGRDYRSLADKMGCTNQYIQYLGSTSDPVLNLITKYMNQKDDRKISELILLLTEMERIDVVHELQPYIEVTPTPREMELRQQRLEEIEELRTIHESYDAFVCSSNAKKDKNFVDKLVKKMESPPYNLRLCLSERDFLGGGCYLDTTAVAIEKRCTKFVAILSTNFDDSEGALYESYIAMDLSPGAQEQRFIPVLIEEEYRNSIPLTIQHLTYLDYIREEEATFWYRLACSLGWKK